MDIEILNEIKSFENDLMRWTEKRDNLRNKMKFCHQHKFEEEIRVAQSELKHFEGIIYDCEQFIKNLKNIVKSYYEKSSKETKS
mgnify:FL=1